MFHDVTTATLEAAKAEVKKVEELMEELEEREEAAEEALAEAKAKHGRAIKLMKLVDASS